MKRTIAKRTLRTAVLCLTAVLLLFCVLAAGQPVRAEGTARYRLTVKYADGTEAVVSAFEAANFAAAVLELPWEETVSRASCEESAGFLYSCLTLTLSGKQESGEEIASVTVELPYPVTKVSAGSAEGTQWVFTTKPDADGNWECSAFAEETPAGVLFLIAGILCVPFAVFVFWALRRRKQGLL